VLDAVPVQKSGSDWDTVQGSPAEVPAVDNFGDHPCTAGFLNLHQVQDLKKYNAINTLLPAKFVRLMIFIPFSMNSCTTYLKYLKEECILKN
jgi:hypothetical protein